MISVPESSTRDHTMKDQPHPSRSGPYSAYYNRPAAFEPSPLTEVGPGTAGGEYLRRYWHPIMIESELEDLPIALRLLGEDLVIFRDRSGEIGLLHGPAPIAAPRSNTASCKSTGSCAAITAGIMAATER